MFLPGLASFPFGIGFGVAAAQKGLSAFEVALMSVTVFAGTSQMVALDLWTHPLPIVQTGGAFWAGAAAAAIATRWLGGFTPGLFAAVGAVALARWAGLG